MNKPTEDIDSPPSTPPPELDPGFGETWIMVMAGVLGVLTVLLIGTAVIVTRSPAGEQPTDTKTSAQAPSPVPTKAAGPQANLGCDDKFIVEIGRSDPPFEKSAVQDLVAGTKGAKYLVANESCSTYGGAGSRLIAYVGPFDTLTDACRAQVKTENLTSSPHRMNADQKGRSYCHCEIDPPRLQVGDGKDGDTATLLAIAEAQQMLKDLRFVTFPVKGDPYGPKTSTGVREFQLDAGVPTTGAVNKKTWSAFRRVTYDGDRTFCPEAGA